MRGQLGLFVTSPGDAVDWVGFMWSVISCSSCTNILDYRKSHVTSHIVMGIREDQDKTQGSFRERDLADFFRQKLANEFYGRDNGIYDKGRLENGFYHNLSIFS